MKETESVYGDKSVTDRFSMTGEKHIESDTYRIAISLTIENFSMTGENLSKVIKTE